MTLLVDTSVWVDHLRKGVPSLVIALEDGLVLMHPFVLGELACGRLDNRSSLLQLLADLPMARSATDSEALDFIERRELMGRGIGYVDVHLLASALLTSPARLWTRDRRLRRVAEELHIEYREEPGR